MLTSLVVVLGLLAAVLVVAACGDQRRRWWKRHAWRYRDPQACEPSDAALVAWRVAKLVAAAVLVAGTFVVNGPVRSAFAYDQRDVWAVAVQAAARLNGRTQDNITEVALTQRARRVVADAAGDRARFKEGTGTFMEDRPKYSLKYSVNTFEITNADGDHPVCLTVFADRLPESTAEVAKITTETTMTEGRC
ncbi:hypothetical protein [Nocardia australiensis]|uniref:hypothetical protein n=1 Tax=Nocardia australiensis TaxID=2887191 RepID=UPI001D14CFC4|nr:hypothetical protein [Nocardia australiensis]